MTSGSQGGEFGLSIQEGKTGKFAQKLEVSECFVIDEKMEDSNSKVQRSNPGGHGIILDLDSVEVSEKAFGVQLKKFGVPQVNWDLGVGSFYC